MNILNPQKKLIKFTGEYVLEVCNSMGIKTKYNIQPL